RHLIQQPQRAVPHHGQPGRDVGLAFSLIHDFRSSITAENSLRGSLQLQLIASPALPQSEAKLSGEYLHEFSVWMYSPSAKRYVSPRASTGTSWLSRQTRRISMRSFSATKGA